MLSIESRAVVHGAVAVLALLAGAATAGAEPLRIRFENGIDATIYTPDELLASRIERDGGSARLTIDARLRYELVTDPRDPAIVNRGDGQFHPMPLHAVVAALEEIRIADADLPVEIYLLPFPRRAILESSARDGRVFLSPGMRPVSEYAVHFTVAHEIGHVYQYRWLPDRDFNGWSQYADLRGIRDSGVYHHGSVHRNRPHEIFAEDFRFLFGGATANYSGGIENDDLSLPTDVAGLDQFVAGLCEPRGAGTPAARLSVAPNPFNPSAEIRVDFAQAPAAAALLRVFDAQGREVRRLFESQPTARQLRVTWDGRTDAGRPAASGIYFARLDYRSDQQSTKLVLVR